MRRSIIGLVALSIVATAAVTVLAGGNSCSTPGAASSPARPAGSRATAKGATAAPSCVNPNGKVAGRFDPAMSACRYSCATPMKYARKDVVAQPGARIGKLTQCPVSGVVFAVGADRPRVRVGGDDYVTCCESCARKLAKNPRRYLKA